MSWRTLTEDDILKGLAGAELAAYRRIQAAADGGDGDVLPEILEAVVMEVRGRIAACAKNELAAGATVPEVCIHHAIAIIRYRLLSRLGVKAHSTRETEYKDARNFLADVSRCMVAIPSATGTDDTTQWYPSPTHTQRKQNFNRSSQDGI